MTVVLLLFVITLSLAVIRVAAIILELTGVPWERAKFHALSAFTNTGYPTPESEEILRHPVRRRIVTSLIVLGNAGFITTIATLAGSVVQSEVHVSLRNMGLIALGVAALVWLTHRPWLGRPLRRRVSRAAAALRPGLRAIRLRGVKSSTGCPRGGNTTPNLRTLERLTHGPELSPPPDPTSGPGTCSQMPGNDHCCTRRRRATHTAHADIGFRCKGVTPMKITRLFVQISATVATALVVVAACSSSSKDDALRTGQAAEALSTGLDFYTNVPSALYVDTASWVGAGLYYWPYCTGDADGGVPGDADGGVSGGCDTTAANDVTLTMTIKGDVAAAGLQYYGPPGFACTQSDAVGSTAVTCHADAYEPYSYADFGLTVTPSTVGDSIIVATTLTEEGVLVRSETRQLTVVEPSADLALWAYGGGTAFVGQTTVTGFVAGNYGPITAENPRFSLTLSGPGRLDSVSVFTGTCTWTDTTATCTAPSFPLFYGVPIQVAFTGTDPGQVTLTGDITSDTPDPFLGNNEASMVFDVVQPTVADLSITMTDAPDPVIVGRDLTYTIDVTNNGPDQADTPIVADYLPYEVLFKSAATTQGTCWGGDWGYLECDLGPLASGASATITVDVTPQQGGDLTNYAWVDTGYSWPPTTIDPDYSNNSAEATTTVRGPNPPVNVYSTSDRFYTVMAAYVDCAHEFVLLEGELHAAYQYVYNESNGFYQVSQIFNPQGLSGKGMSTGDTYHGTGMTRNSVRFTSGFSGSYSFQNNFRIIGEKTGNNLLIHATTVVVVGPDGSLKTSVDKYSFECK